jgi:tetratricopeptide (TPR) repeat protein
MHDPWYKKSLSRQNMTQEDRSAAASRKATSALAAKADAQARAALQAAVQQYQAAVQLLQQGRYEKALTALEKLLPDAPIELRERCRMYISTCQRQLEKPALSFLTPEEHFDYAISQLNTGYYEEAREQLEAILANKADADYAHYGLAVLDAMTGHSQNCLENLARAIELNPRNRLQARVDNDFQNVVDDPRFTELLYPEVP